MSRQISVIAIERWRKGTYILKALTGPNTGKNYFPNGEWKSGGRTKGKRFAKNMV